MKILLDLLLGLAHKMLNLKSSERDFISMSMLLIFIDSLLTDYGLTSLFVLEVTLMRMMRTPVTGRIITSAVMKVCHLIDHLVSTKYFYLYFSLNG